MDAVEVYGIITNRLTNSSEYSGEIEQRAIVRAVQACTAALIDRTYVKEDMGFQTGRGIAKDERLAALLGPSIRTTVIYNQSNMLQGTRRNGAPKKGDFTTVDIDNENHYAIGIPMPEDFMFLIDFDLLTTNMIHRFTSFSTPTNIPQPLIPNNDNVYVGGEIRSLTEYEIKSLKEYNRIRNNMFANPYKSKYIAIPTSPEIHSAKDVNGAFVTKAGVNFYSTKYSAAFVNKAINENNDVMQNAAFPIFSNVKLTNLGKCPMFYWVVTGAGYDVIELIVNYYSYPKNFHIDLEVPANNVGLNFPIQIVNMIIEMAILYIIENRIPDGDKYQVIRQNVMNNDITQAP